MTLGARRDNNAAGGLFVDVADKDKCRRAQGASRMADLLRPTEKEIIRQLEAGKLPKMVDWFDPFVLGMFVIRTLISSTIGENADQRPMQEAADGQRDMGVLTRRHRPASEGDQFLFDPESAGA
jgi:hypothetical protein